MLMACLLLEGLKKKPRLFPLTLDNGDKNVDMKHSSAQAMARRRFLGWGLTLAVSPVAQAEAVWPQKPITLIVPWPAGGATDLSVRILAEEASGLLGQPVVVSNRPGAAGTMVVPLLKAAAPDGYTIGQLPLTAVRFALMNKVAWDPIRDLAPILQVSGVTFGLLVPASSPWKSFKDMLDWAKQHPGELLLGSTGIGSTPHLAMEEMLLDQGITYTHVPYKGTADQMLALASGTIMAGMNSTGFAPWVDQGKLRLLAVASEQRSPHWPAVPTFKELGFERAVFNSPWGLVAPTGTPVAVVQKLHDVFYKAMQHPRHVQELARYDQDLSYLDTAAYQRALRQAVPAETRLLQRMKLLHTP